MVDSYSAGYSAFRRGDPTLGTLRDASHSNAAHAAVELQLKRQKAARVGGGKSTSQRVTHEQVACCRSWRAAEPSSTLQRGSLRDWNTRFFRSAHSTAQTARAAVRAQSPRRSCWCAAERAAPWEASSDHQRMRMQPNADHRPPSTTSFVNYFVPTHSSKWCATTHRAKCEASHATPTRSFCWSAVRQIFAASTARRSPPGDRVIANAEDGYSGYLVST
jgi:hypothetical protein